MRVETNSMRRVAVFTQELPVRLADEEMLERAQRLAHVLRELELHEVKARALREELKKTEEKMQTEVAALTQVIHSHEELREIHCEGWLDFNRGVYEDVRTDTGAVLEGTSRKMSQEERQGDLPLASTGHRGRRPPDITVVKKPANGDKDVS